MGMLDAIREMPSAAIPYVHALFFEPDPDILVKFGDELTMVDCEPLGIVECYYCKEKQVRFVAEDGYALWQPVCRNPQDNEDFSELNELVCHSCIEKYGVVDEAGNFLDLRDDTVQIEQEPTRDVDDEKTVDQRRELVQVIHDLPEDAIPYVSELFNLNGTLGDRLKGQAMCLSCIPLGIVTCSYCGAKQVRYAAVDFIAPWEPCYMYLDATGKMVDVDAPVCMECVNKYGDTSHGTCQMSRSPKKKPR